MSDLKLKNLIYEFNLTIPPHEPLATDLIKNVLMVSGVSTNRIVERVKDKRTIIVSAYLETKKEVKDLSRRLKAWNLKGVRVTFKRLPKKFWLERWKKDWRPFKLTRKIDVVPVWQKKKYKISRRKFILLDTISAFGTGLHETTKFMSQAIEDLEGKFESFFDIGTGSGILSIVAFYSGAQSVTAIDIGPISVATAQENMKVNGQKFNQIKAIDFNQFKPRTKSFDLVAANLITHDLISMRQKIVSFVNNGQWLALSGISLENLDLLLQVYQQLPLTKIKVIKGKKWAAVVFRKAPTSLLKQ